MSRKICKEKTGGLLRFFFLQFFGEGEDGGFDGGEGIIGQAQKSWWQKLAFLWGNNALKYKQMAKKQ